MSSFITLSASLTESCIVSEVGVRVFVPTRWSSPPTSLTCLTCLPLATSLWSPWSPTSTFSIVCLRVVWTTPRTAPPQPRSKVCSE